MNTYKAPVINKPISFKRIMKLSKAHPDSAAKVHHFEVIVPVSLTDLIDCNIDDLNNLIEDRVYQGGMVAFLGLCYEAVRVDKNGSVLIRVNCYLDIIG